MIFDLENVTVMAFILMRMSGCIYFNPIFGRKNFPAMVKTGMVLVLTYFIYSYSDIIPPVINSFTEYAILLLAEFLIGFFIGFIVNFFITVMIMGGEVIDYQIGISMSKIYDPQSNISMSINATLFNILFILLFFISNGHLTLMSLFTTSAQVIPYGEVQLSQDAIIGLIRVFSQCMVLAIKFALPIITIELLLEIGVGVLMKAIPQINVFVVNVQIKMFIGILGVLVFFAPLISFIENMINIMFNSIENIMKLMS